MFPVIKFFFYEVICQKYRPYHIEIYPYIFFMEIKLYFCCYLQTKIILEVFFFLNARLFKNKNNSIQCLVYKYCLKC